MTTRYPHVDYSRLPGHMQDGARDYVEHGYEPGGFLLAVLCNDLTGAFGHADTENAAALGEWARWLWMEAPSQCWGSRAKVAAWIAKHAAESVEERSEPDGPADSYWQSDGADVAKYRAQMRDAGRGAQVA